MSTDEESAAHLNQSFKKFTTFEFCSLSSWH